MNIIEKRIDEIIPYEKNPRRNDKAVTYVVNSIKQFGFKVPLVIDKDNVIVCGHTRWKAAKRLKMKTLPCVIADDLTDEQIRAFRLADNKVAEIADWDMNLLNFELADLNFEMSKFGFDVDDDDWDLTTEAVEDGYNVNDALKSKTEINAKQGDIYILGDHRLMCGDALNEADVKRLLDGNYCELTFTDPPYEMETKGGGILKKANSMKQIRKNGVDKFNPKMLKLYSDTNIYCHNKLLIKKYIELAETNNKPYDLAIYKKENTAPNYKGHLMTDIEYIAVIGEQNMQNECEPCENKNNGIMLDDIEYLAVVGNQDPNKKMNKEMYSKCYIGNKDVENKLSYSKPVALCFKFIKLFSKKNVLDLFGGSGSTLIACEQSKRKCFMMELSPEYVDIIIDRWEKFTGQKAVKIA